jgi:hypothetical protein
MLEDRTCVRFVALSFRSAPRSPELSKGKRRYKQVESTRFIACVPVPNASIRVMLLEDNERQRLVDVVRRRREGKQSRATGYCSRWGRSKPNNKYRTKFALFLERVLFTLGGCLIGRSTTGDMQLMICASMTRFNLETPSHVQFLLLVAPEVVSYVCCCLPY